MKKNFLNLKTNWDLTDYFASDEDWQKHFEIYCKKVDDFAKFSGKLVDEKNILECLKADEDLSVLADALYIFANCKHDLNVADGRCQAMLCKIENAVAHHAQVASFVVPQLLKLDDNFLLKLLEDKRFCAFSKTIKNVVREKPHVLDESQEKLLSAVSMFAGDFATIHSNFENGDLKFCDVTDSKGKKHKMNEQLASLHLKSADDVLRENAYRELQGAYGRFNNFLFANYVASVKKDVFFAKSTKFDSSLEKALFFEEVDKTVYANLLSSVRQNLWLDQKYFLIKKKLLGLKTFKLSDVYYNPIKLSQKYDFEQAMDLVCKALSPLGREYVDYLKFMAESGKIDVFPKENKRGGAYEIMAPRKSPFVLTNFVGTYSDVSTLAHELGHAMHSVLSNKNQSPANASYTIFLAEIASTVNETILSKFMIDNAKSKKEKIFFINEFLHEFHSTVFRQSMFADFEEQIHKIVEQNAEISAQKINQLYIDLAKTYFGKNVKLFDEVRFEWSRIPHFFTPFYVYKYATGIISAINIVCNLFSHKIEVDDYKKFLSSGCTNTPTELLKIVKVDFDTTKPFEVAFDYVKTLIDQLNDVAKQTSTKTKNTRAKRIEI